MAASMILAESGSKSWPVGVRQDRSRKHESTKTRRNQEPGLYLFLAVRGQRETPLFGNGPGARCLFSFIRVLSVFYPWLRNLRGPFMDLVISDPVRTALAFRSNCHLGTDRE